MVSVSSISIDLSWAPPEENSQNGIIRSYNVTVEDASSRLTVITKKEGITVEGLEPFTHYTVSIAAHTIATGPFSLLLPVTTLVDG